MTDVYYELPTYIVLPRKKVKDKKVSLNLNVYRNIHYTLNNELKKAFVPLKQEAFKAEKIRIYYIVEKSTKRMFDIMNVISVVDKYFLDWLVDKQYIPDDNFNCVDYGGIYGYAGLKEDKVIAKIKILRSKKDERNNENMGSP